MNNELQLAPPPAVPMPVSKEQAAAWVGLAQEKNRVAFELEKGELAAQSILLRVSREDAAYEAIDIALMEYRKAFTNLQELRKPFTNQVDAGIVQPLMAFEKRVDPKANATYTALSARSLALRKAEADQAAIANAKNQEVASFKAFVANEFSRVATEYRAIIRREIAGHYATMLGDHVENPALATVKDMLRGIVPPPVAKFNARYLTNQELSNIFNDIPKLDYEGYYNDLMRELDDTFANYSSDLANAAAAIEHHAKQAKLQEMEEANKAKEEQALNTLIATAETVVIDESKIKRTVQVIVIESEAWAKTVMAAFITNMPKLVKYIRVRSWSKLSIGQMATYLGQYATEEGVTFQGLQLEGVEK
jgi:hypothetical protein